MGTHARRRGRWSPNGSLAVAARPFFSATGALVRCVPEGPEREELLRLVRIGVEFARRQQLGRPRNALYAHVVAVVGRMPAPVTFDALVAELQLDARSGGTPILHVSRSFATVTYETERKDQIEITFGRLRNVLTDAKKENSRFAFP